MTKRNRVATISLLILGTSVACGSDPSPGRPGGPAGTAGLDGSAGTAGGSGGAGGSGAAGAGGTAGASGTAGSPSDGGGTGGAGGGSGDAGGGTGGGPGDASGGSAGAGGAAGDAGPGGTDSPGLIDTALKNGSITAEQALLYEIFLLFNDPRLPAAYRGDDSHLYETDVLARAVRQFESLSPETRATLTPFLLLPSEPGSWADPAVQPSQAAREPDVVEFPSLLCKGRHTPDWIPATRPGAHVQVWYDRTEPGDDTLANTLLNVIESTIWPKLFGTLGVKAPLPDAEPPSNLDCAGSDQRLDVFLVDIGSYHGLTYPRDNAQAFTNCKAVPSVIYVNKNKPAHEAIVTHELMHASQNAYNSVACTDAYGWLKDATAQWAIDYVFHGALGDNQIEQGWADCYTRSPQKALDDRSAGSCSRMGRNTNRDYGSYLFFQFMSNNGSPALVKAALDNLEGYATSLEAVARVSGSGADYFRDKWKDFSKALLNRTFPGGFLQPNFQTWDSLADTPEMLGDEVWSGVTDKKFIFTPSIANLSTHFYRFTFPDTSARSFLFRNGFFKAYKNDNKAIRVTALWHDASGTWREEDWSGYEFVGLCRDRKDQRTDVLYVIVSNGEWQSSGGGTLSTSEPFFLEASNIGCWKYKGTSACQLDGTPSGGSTRVESVVSFAQDARMNGLTSTHPMIPDSLRTGVHLLMPLAVGGAAADGSYTLSASRTTGNCPFTFGITSPLGGTESGVLQLNTFPDLEVPPAGGDLVTFVANPGRAYRMAASSIKIYTAQPPGQKPSGQPCDPELVPVTVLAFAPEPPQPLVSANGNISFSSSSPNCVGTLQPQLEP